MRLQISLALAGLLISACVPSPQQAGDDSQPQDVSIIQLIATPERFDGKQVRVIGYLHQEFEKSGIYLHQVDHDLSISRNAVWVNGRCNSGTSSLNDQYVVIEGRFSGGEQGHFGAWSGALNDIIRCVSWKHPSGASNNSFKPNPLRGSA
jgi:hypothetical protein